MADPERRGGNNAFVYFIIGALVVAIAVIGYVALDAGGGSQAIDIDTPDVDLEVETDEVEVDAD